MASEALVSKARSLLEKEMEIPVLKCLLSRSEILRTCVEATPDEFQTLLEEETLDIHGKPLTWLRKHSEFIENCMEFHPEGGRCPTDHYILCPEEKQVLDEANGYIFHFLKRYSEGASIGTYTESRNDGYEIEWEEDLTGTRNNWYKATISQAYADVMRFLMWDTDKQNKRIEHLIECGLLTRPRTLGHSFTVKGKRREKRVVTKRSIAAPTGRVGSDSNSYNFSNNDEDNFVVRKPRAPRVATNFPHAHLAKEKPSRLRASGSFSKKQPRKRLSEKHPGKTGKKAGKARTLKHSRRR